MGIMDDDIRRIFDERERKTLRAYQEKAQEFSASFRAKLSESRRPVDLFGTQDMEIGEDGYLHVAGTPGEDEQGGGASGGEST